MTRIPSFQPFLSLEASAVEEAEPQRFKAIGSGCQGGGRGGGQDGGKEKGDRHRPCI